MPGFKFSSKEDSTNQSCSQYRTCHSVWPGECALYLWGLTSKPPFPQPTSILTSAVSLIFETIQNQTNPRIQYKNEVYWNLTLDTQIAFLRGEPFSNDLRTSTHTCHNTKSLHLGTKTNHSYCSQTPWCRTHQTKSQDCTRLYEQLFFEFCKDFFLWYGAASGLISQIEEGKSMECERGNFSRCNCSHVEILRIRFRLRKSLTLGEYHCGTLPAAPFPLHEMSRFFNRFRTISLALLWGNPFFT